MGFLIFFFLIINFSFSVHLMKQVCLIFPDNNVTRSMLGIQHRFLTYNIYRPVSILTNCENEFWCCQPIAIWFDVVANIILWEFKFNSQIGCSKCDLEFTKLRTSQIVTRSRRIPHFLSIAIMNT